MKRLSISRLSEFCEESINQSVNQSINQSIILLVETNRRRCCVALTVAMLVPCSPS
jgi:hypothetical protein